MIRNNMRRAISFITAGVMLLSVAFPALNLQAEERPVPSETAGVTQFMDCFESMTLVESLSNNMGTTGRSRMETLRTMPE